MRSGELPTRLMSLRYGADLVWSPEIIDRKLIGCVRRPNERLNCVDFVTRTKEQTSDIAKENRESKETLVLRTHQLERSRLVLQLGTASPALAVEAASLVARDVAGIDLNAGCPKHFSIHAGMGAGLLKTPDTLIAILDALVRDVGSKFGVGISVKIRILDTPEETFALVRRLVKTGIVALTVHCRRVPMRPRERAIRDGYLAGVADICHEAGVVCIANGDVYCGGDLATLRATYGVDSAMIATAAERNMSCFAANSVDKVRDWHDVAREFVAVASAVENHVSNTKYVLTQMIPGKAPERQLIARAKTYEDFSEVIGSEKGILLDKFVIGSISAKRRVEENESESEEQPRKSVKQDAVERSAAAAAVAV